MFIRKSEKIELFLLKLLVLLSFISIFLSLKRIFLYLPIDSSYIFEIQYKYFKLIYKQILCIADMYNIKM